jgi:hypothetical protein
MENKEKLPKNFAEFSARYPDATELNIFASYTTNSYYADSCLWMFDSDDGHLACVAHLPTHTILYECECIKRGKKVVGSLYG